VPRHDKKEEILSLPLSSWKDLDLERGVWDSQTLIQKLFGHTSNGFLLYDKCDVFLETQDKKAKYFVPRYDKEEEIPMLSS